MSKALKIRDGKAGEDRATVVSKDISVAFVGEH